MASVEEYEEVLNKLSSLISRRTRADGSNKGDRFDLIFDYLKMLELDENAFSGLNVIHVAGTKGKGSTCTFVESILRNCGFRTGLYTSPHLIDIRERFKLDGVELSEKKFVSYFWWCFNKLQESTNDDDIPMPNYFRFLTLLAFKIFSAEKVDVAILEVGLGGKFDATNVVKAPVVCGVSSLGYDHMEILGNTLGQIAGEKAGIFKENVKAFTVPQPEEAMRALEERASQLGIPLLVIPPLRAELLKGQKLGLTGEHQYINAGLAVSLCRHWLKNTGNAKEMHFDDEDLLPDKFIKGLAAADLPGRAQIVSDPFITRHTQGNLTEGLIFYLDGAHSPESMEVCARWFSNSIKKEEQTFNSIPILLFNCMSVRDPQLLLPRLVNTCAEHGVKFHKSIFAPNLSVFNQVTSHATHIPDSSQVDVSWQQKLQMVWQDLEKGLGDSGSNKTTSSSHENRRVPKLNDTIFKESSSVVPSLLSTVEELRDTALQNPSFGFKVLVTGSLHLVGDVLKVIHMKP